MQESESDPTTQTIWNHGRPRKQENPVKSRIIGGSKAKQGRYPYIVALETEGASETMAPACGGTLIAPDLVLSAAQ